ncbi:MAG: hypothetical protein J5529_06765 [Prevotella sp.]|nr:hypothetical protein [Prevotella sp.]
MELFFLYVLLIGLAIHAGWKEWKKKKESDTISLVANVKGEQRAKLLEKWADNALEQLHCKVAWATEDEARVGTYDYQNGHFKLHVEKSSPYVRMSYLFCYNSSLDNIDIARSVANRCNINSDNLRVVYSVNDEKHEIDMHLISSLLLHPDTAKNTFVDAMASTFSWQNALVRRFDEMEKAKDETGETDGEKTSADRKREIFMVRQQEMRLQGDEKGVFRASLGEGVALQTLLEKAMGLYDVQPLRMEVYSNVVEVLRDEKGILAYRLDDLSKELRGEEGRKYASATLWVVLPDDPKTERTIAITINDEGSDGDTAWFRVTATLVPLPASTSHPYRRQPDVNTCSVLMARDNVSRQQLIEESNYMWKEAVQKLKNGEEGTLTEEQALIAGCTDSSLAQLLYHGKKLFLSKRYFEALPLFESAFRSMQPRFDSMKNREKEAFFEVIYHIGFCYSDLKQYDRALAYLDMLSGLHRISYTTELVNAMVNSGDFRSMSTIDGLMETINDNLDLEEGEKPAEYIQSFLAFLNRRKAFLLIDKNKYEEAKKLLNKMLEDPLSSDYAINELAYIQRMEKEGQ